MSTPRILYLILATLGLALPLAAMLGKLDVPLLSFGGLLGAEMGPGGGLDLNQWLGIAALCTFVVVEAIYRRDRLPLICVPLAILLGLGFALPLYLLLRSRKLA